jgi:uncharacterized protein VirK/YbjX
MTHERKQTVFSTAVYFRLFYAHIKNIIVRIPFLSVAINGWQLASRVFIGEDKYYRRKQKWKSFFYALINPLFTYKWLEILKSPVFLLVSTYRKRIYFKPFRVYMSIKWTKKQKIKVIFDTYRFIMSKGDEFLQVITNNEGLEIARFKLSETIEGVLNLGYDERYRKEGELVLSFVCNQLGGMIAAAAFSFEEMENGRWVCRIGCIQGHKRNEEYSSKAAQKLLHGLRPKSLIIYAVQEFSRQLGFNAVYGVGDAIQAYRRKHAVYLPWRHAIRFDYDAIWSEAGGRLESEGWYELPLTPVRRNINEIKVNKRALYRRRYFLLDSLSIKIADAVKRLTHDGFPQNNIDMLLQKPSSHIN